jgi:hypothetical protein
VDQLKSSELSKIREAAIAEGVIRQKETVSQYEAQVNELQKNLSLVCHERDESQEVYKYVYI